MTARWITLQVKLPRFNQHQCAAIHVLPPPAQDQKHVGQRVLMLLRFLRAEQRRATNSPRREDRHSPFFFFSAECYRFAMMRAISCSWPP